MRPCGRLRFPERGRPCGAAGLGCHGRAELEGWSAAGWGCPGARRARWLRLPEGGRSWVRPSGRVRGVPSPRVAPSGDGCPGCCPDAGGGCQGVCGLQAALGAGPASSLPQVSDVGGPGDLMETKVKENANFRESCGSHEGPGKTGGLFCREIQVSSRFHTWFSFSPFFFFFLAWFHHVIEDAME